MSQSTRKIRYQRTREEIIRAARKLILKDGIDALSLRKVAQMVDYSPGALYEYFDNKEDLINTVAELSIANLARRLSSIPENLSIEERIIALGMAYLKFASEDTEEFELIFHAMKTQLGGADQPVPQDDMTFRILQEAVGEYLAQIGIAYTPTSLIMMTYQLWALVHGMAILHTGFLSNFEADFNTAHREAIQNMLAGWQAHPPK